MPEFKVSIRASLDMTLAVSGSTASRAGHTAERLVTERLRSLPADWRSMLSVYVENTVRTPGPLTLVYNAAGWSWWDMETGSLINGSWRSEDSARNWLEQSEYREAGVE